MNFYFLQTLGNEISIKSLKIKIAPQRIFIARFLSEAYKLEKEMYSKSNLLFSF